MEVKPYTMSEESTFGGTSTETQFVGENPYNGAKIIYYLSKRHTFGKMSVKVYDKDGNFVITLNAGKKKGLNIVPWGFTGMVPVSAKGKTISQGGFLAPRVAAGTYKVVVEKGKDVYETSIQVEYDKNAAFTLAERKIQQDATNKLYKMTEDLAYLVYQIDTWMEHAEATSKANPAMKKTADALKAELQALKETLVITTGDNYVGSAEKQLREKMGDIYSTIGSYYGAPSATELENLAKIEGEFKAAQDKYAGIDGKSLAKYKAGLAKAQLKEPEMKSYADFVKKD